MKTKVCRNCGVRKSISKFGKDKRKKGLKARCKKCESELNGERKKKRRNGTYVYVSAIKNKIMAQHYRMMKFKVRRCLNCLCVITGGNKKIRCEPCQKKHDRILAKNRYHSDPAYRDRLIQASCAYQKNNRPKIAAGDRRRRVENPERERHKDKIKDYRQRGASGSHIVEQWNKLVEDTGHRCLMCGRPDTEIELTRDHIVPLSLGGTNNIENIQPLCRSCNSKKGNRNTLDLRPVYSVALDTNWIV